VVGLNQRWRLYRYKGETNDIFRPHTDGAWSGSGLVRADAGPASRAASAPPSSFAGPAPTAVGDRDSLWLQADMY